MEASLIQPIASLGVGGFAVLVMWWMYQSAATERKSNDARLDERDAQYRALEKEVRQEITAQLIASTQTNAASQKVMERVLDQLGATKK